jgi:ribosome modulation factor
MVTVAEARFKGYKDAKAGKTRDQCRYSIPRLRDAWHNGYDCWLAEVAKTEATEADDGQPTVRDTTLAELKTLLAGDGK